MIIERLTVLEEVDPTVVGWCVDRAREMVCRSRSPGEEDVIIRRTTWVRGLSGPSTVEIPDEALSSP